MSENHETQPEDAPPPPENAGPPEPEEPIVNDQGEAMLTEVVGGIRIVTIDRPVPPPAPAPRHITRLAFMQRFLDSEAIAIDLASIGATPQAAGVRRYLNLVGAASYIDLDRPDTRAGVIALETAGLLQEGRAAEILDAPLSDGERPRGAGGGGT